MTDIEAALADERTIALCPISIAEANVFVRDHHRHNRPTSGGKFAVSIQIGRASCRERV